MDNMNNTKSTLRLFSVVLMPLAVIHIGFIAALLVGYGVSAWINSTVGWLVATVAIIATVLFAVMVRKQTMSALGLASE